jgi:hypothetical protein
MTDHNQEAYESPVLTAHGTIAGLTQSAALSGAPATTTTTTTKTMPDAA